MNSGRFALKLIMFLKNWGSETQPFWLRCYWNLKSTVNTSCCFGESKNSILCREVKVMFYGAGVWDPWLIVAQIVCVQCLYYVTLGVFLAILVGTRVSRMSMVYLFDYATVTASTVTGWFVIASFLLTSLAGAGYLLYLVERAKKCLDFSATLYVIHLFICIVYGGWPSSITWWLVNVTGLAVMALLGEYLCIRRELQEIPISRYRSMVDFAALMLICLFILCINFDAVLFALYPWMFDLSEIRNRQEQNYLAVVLEELLGKAGYQKFLSIGKYYRHLLYGNLFYVPEAMTCDKSSKGA